jgi:GT2 family glycosyltransferase/glycosyltransferase involved in cell wall biosynthesis
MPAARFEPPVHTRRQFEDDVQPTIIIPIYNAPAELDDCVAAVLRHTASGCRMVLIDDASSDPLVQGVLDKYRDRPGIEIHRNERNLGFTRTVNRGIEIAGRSDVVLLNSDTKVTPDWLENLRRAAYSGSRVATATPFSNNAGAFSVPEYGRDNPLPAWLTLDDYARLVTQASERRYPGVPTGSGFCMYIRRDCLDDVGGFDAEAFPRGYGEENDFCMRALQRGWRHVIDDATLVYHARAASFGTAKDELLKKGRAVIDQRYSDYKRLVRAFERDGKIRRARARIAAALARSRASAAPVRVHAGRSRLSRRLSTVRSRAQKGVRRLARTVFPKGVTAARELKRQQRNELAGRERIVAAPTAARPRALFVISTETGGTPQTNQDLMAALESRYECFVLRSNAKSLTLQRWASGQYQTLRIVRLPAWLEPFPHIDQSYDRVVAGWLSECAIDVVHIRHIIWHSLSLPRVARSLGIPVVFSFHDFYTVCPTIRLVDENDVYCGGTCTTTAGPCSYALWTRKEFPPLKNAAVHPWREQMTTMLEFCDAYVTTSASARALVQKFFPVTGERPFPIIEHGRDFATFEKLGRFPEPSERVRVLVPGNISATKGAHILQRLQSLNTGHVEFHLMGDYIRELEDTPNVFLYGPYERARFAEMARKIAPHFGAVFSIWPETFCHTLTEMWASGLPVVAFDLGAVGDRIRRHRGGWLIEEITPQAALQSLVSVASDRAGFEARLAEVDAWQRGPGAQEGCARMAGAYKALYESVLATQRRAQPPDVSAEKGAGAMTAEGRFHPAVF